MPTKSAVKTTIPRDPASVGPAVHPGVVLLEDFLKPLALTQKQAAKDLGTSTVRLNELVLGKRGITADTALRLSARFKTTAQFWMHMQANYDLKQALQARTRANREG